MKLQVVRFMYEPPSLEIIPETDYEAAVLGRYWMTAKLGMGKASESFSGLSYGIKFVEPGRAA